MDNSAKGIITDIKDSVYKSFQNLMRNYSAKVDHVFFIQVGANDGVINDPLHPLVKSLKWQGILIEPQQRVFKDRLLKVYQDIPGLAFENVGQRVTG